MIFNILAGVAFVLAAGALAGGFWLAKNRDKHIEASRRWPLVPATVQSSELQQHGDTFIPLVTYTYEVAGQAYENNNVQFGAWAGTQAEGEALVAKVPPGAITNVHVNPEDPADVVMLTSTNSGNYRLAGAICAGGLAATGVALLFMH